MRGFDEHDDGSLAVIVFVSDCAIIFYIKEMVKLCRP